MILKDSFIIEAPINDVWALLQDVHRVSTCVPGVDSVEEIGPDMYNGVLKVKVGPISTSFQGEVTLTEQTYPPGRLVAEVSGNDKASASQVKATFTGLLSSAEGGGTQLDYEMDVALRGRLAQFGLVVVKATAKKMASEFVKRFTALLAELDKNGQEA